MRFLFKINKKFSFFLNLILFVNGFSLTIVREKNLSPVSINIQHIHGIKYIPLSYLIEILDGEEDWDHESKKLAITIDGHEIVILIDSPVVFLNGRGRNIGMPAILSNGRILVPMNFLSSIIVPAISYRVMWDEKREVLTLGKHGTIDRFDSKVNKDKFKIVLDAGHGGKDPGAIGPTGLQEKNINLDIALRLKNILERQFSVFLTRNDDTFVPLRERTNMANRVGADLFISIHCNSVPLRKNIKKNSNEGGFETYFLSLAKTSEARAVEAIENSALRFEMSDTLFTDFNDIRFILLDLAQNEYLKQSSDLAGCIQEALGRFIHIKDRGLSQAGFFVLNGAYMPAILLETAFISNKGEEKLLKSEKFRQNVSEAIAYGVDVFLKKYNKR